MIKTTTMITTTTTTSCLVLEVDEDVQHDEDLGRKDVVCGLRSLPEPQLKSFCHPGDIEDDDDDDGGGGDNDDDIVLVTVIG